MLNTYQKGKFTMNRFLKLTAAIVLVTILVSVFAIFPYAAPNPQEAPAVNARPSYVVNDEYEYEQGEIYVPEYYSTPNTADTAISISTVIALLGIVGFSLVIKNRRR